MAKVLLRNKRSQRKQRGEGTPIKINGNPAAVRFAGMNLKPIAGEQITGHRFSFRQIDQMEKAYDIAAAGGYLRPIENVTDVDAFLKEVSAAVKVMNEKYDHYEVNTSYKFTIDDEDEVFAGYQRIGFGGDGIFTYALEDLNNHPKEIQDVVYSCFNCLMEMGFCTIDQIPVYDYFMQPTYGDGCQYYPQKKNLSQALGVTKAKKPRKKKKVLSMREMIVKNIKEERYCTDDDKLDEQDLDNIEMMADCMMFYKNFRFDFPYDEKLLRKYAKRNDDLGEWCKLCLIYRYNGFKVTDFQPMELHDDQGTGCDPVPLFESHIISVSRHDIMHAEHEEHINANWGEAGFLPLTNYEVIHEGKMVKPLKTPEEYGLDSFMTMADDLGKIWGFNLEKLKFH